MKITLSHIFRIVFHAQILLKNGAQPIFVSLGNTGEFQSAIYAAAGRRNGELMLYLFSPLTVCLIILALALGAVMGSFLNCAAWRLVHRESVLRGRSHCAECGHTLGALDLVPIFSYLALRGKCRYCGERISPRYPAVEAICALSYCTLLLRFDTTWQCLRLALLMSLLLFGALVDFEDGWIPDRVSIIAGVAYVPLAILEGGSGLLLSGAVCGGVMLLVLLAVVLVMEKIMKTEVMGGGDLKLFAVLGLYFGWRQGIFLVLVSCVLGLAAMALLGRLRRRTETRFAPVLFFSAWITALAGAPVTDWYMGLF